MSGRRRPPSSSGRSTQSIRSAGLPWPAATKPKSRKLSDSGAAANPVIPFAPLAFLPARSILPPNSLQLRRLPRRQAESAMKPLFIAAIFAGLFTFSAAGQAPEPNPAPSLDDQLRNAASDGDLSAIEQLLGKGAAIGAADDGGDTPLILAAMTGKTEAVKLLLAKGANIEEKDQQSYTPLFAAVTGGYTETVKFLLAKGANIEAPDNSGQSPLYWAAMSGKIDLINVLLDSHAQIEARNAMGQTPLMGAA